MNMNDAFIGSLIFNKNGDLIIKNIYDNGVYNASDDDVDGYSSVVVNVPKGGLVATKFTVISTTYTTS